MQLPNFPHRRLIGTAAMAGAVALMPAAGSAATAGSPASPARSARAVTAYVVNVNSGTVTPVNTVTNTAGKPIGVGANPHYIAITPNGKTAYVVRWVPGIADSPSASVPLAGTVIPINTATGTTGQAINVGRFPQAIAITPNGKTAYVTSGSGVIPINTATNTAGKPINGGGAGAIAITPDGKTAYVLNSGSGTVTPISAVTGKVSKTIKVGSSPIAIAITPNGKTAYVVNEGSGTVTPILTASNTALNAIKAGIDPQYIAITPNGKTAYVVNHGYGGEIRKVPGNTVTPIGTATNTAGKAIRVGNYPGAIAITPDGKTAYVLNSGLPLPFPVSEDTVYPIVTATNTALKAITVGNGPIAIAITP